MMPTTTMERPKVGVGGILARPDGRVLLAQRGREPNLGRWAFPGGSVKFQESLADALVREFWEETHLNISSPILAWEAEIKDNHRIHFVVLDYVVESTDYDIRAGSDVDDLAWVGPEEWFNLNLADGMAACLNDVGVRHLIGWEA